MIALRMRDAGFENFEKIHDYTKSVVSKRIFSTITQATWVTRTKDDFGRKSKPLEIKFREEIATRTQRELPTDEKDELAQIAFVLFGEDEYISHPIERFRYRVDGIKRTIKFDDRTEQEAKRLKNMYIDQYNQVHK